MAETDPKGKLDDLYWGTLKDLHMAEESLFLEETISQYASKINEKNFGNLFGKLQIMLLNNSLLYLRRIFERQRGYPLKSIPAILDYLTEHKDCLDVSDRSFLKNKLDQLNEDPKIIKDLNTKEAEDSEIIIYCVSFFKSKLENIDKEGPLEKIKGITDKTIAHNEDVEAQDLKQPLEEDINKVIEFSKIFISIIAGGFLNSTPIYDNNRCGRGMKRLLIEADVIKDDSPYSS